MATVADPTPLISYFIRKGWYQHVQSLCEDVLERKGQGEVAVLFWRAFAICMEGSFTSAIRELESLKKKKEIEFPSIAALIYTHNQCKLIDHDEVAQLETLLDMAEERATEASQLMCATFYWYIKDHSSCKKRIDKICGGRIAPESPVQTKATVLRGWVDLTLEPKSKRDLELKSNSIQFFESVKVKDDPDLLFGIAKYYDMKKSYQKSLDCLDELVVKFPWFSPALNEKALILLKTGEWDLCTDVTERVLNKNPYDIEALRLRVLFLLSREGKVKEASSIINELLEALTQKESANAHLYYEISKTNARLSDRSPEVLEQNIKIINKALSLQPEEGKFQAEKGYQLCLLNEFDLAMDTFKEALKLDESNENSLHGLIYCQIKLGKIDDAAQQMEFLNIIQESIGASAELMFLQALLAWHKDKDRSAQIKLLQKTIQLHMDKLKEFVQQGDSTTYQLMTQLNPQFLVEVAKEFILHGSSYQIDGSTGGESVLSAVAKGASILEKLLKKSPGFVNAQLALANARFLINDVERSYSTLNTILSMDKDNSEAHLLMARICLEREHYRAAAKSLEDAVSHDFSIRRSIVFHLVKAKILENSGDLNEALNLLQGVMKMKGVKGGNFTSTESSGVSIHDAASVYVHLANIHSQMNNLEGATSVVMEAMNVFRGTVEEVRVLVANSELAIKRNDFPAAIAILNNVPKDSPAYSKAQTVKADIYLHHQRDKRAYANCYLHLVELNPCASTYVNLGEAYLKIQKLDEAIDAFRSALEIDPTNYKLARKIGQVLISKHEYHKACDYYESALKQAPNRSSLRHDLTELYSKLHRYDQALRVIQQAPTKNSDDIHELIQDVNMLLLMPTILSGINRPEQSIQSLQKAQGLQKTILDKLKIEQPDLLSEQRQVMANICFDIAELYAKEKDSEKAIQHYNLALRADETHEKSILALANTYLRTGELDMCETKCSTLLRLNPANEDAAIMLADIMLQKEDNETAMYHFRNLLEKKPDNFAALSQYISMLRKAGHLEEAPKFFKAAERTGPRAMHSSGLHFCKGLYHRYRNNIHEAISELNKARVDQEFGYEATINMVEIYLNPDNENLWEDTGNTRDQGENIRIGNKLLEGLRMNLNPRVRILEVYAILAVKTKPMAEKAISLFMELLEDDRDYVPALLGISMGYMLTKQQPKARNQLKRIAKMPYDKTLSEEFERSYLLLADIYVGRSKYDLAQELCKKVLAHNKSSGKAWEALGLIMEKENSYRDAADCYQEAWKCEGEASATIGFKLAFNYLKAQKYVEAVDVCNKVLSLYPDYPKIRHEILEKAYMGFRP